MKFGNEILIGRFLESLEKFPGRSALEAGGQSFTYKELGELAAGVAYQIGNVDTASGLIGVLAERSPAAYYGILGILLNGRGYLPLNKRFPAMRNLTMLKASYADCIVVSRECSDEMEEILQKTDRDLKVILCGFNSTEKLNEKYPRHKFLTAGKADISMQLASATDPEHPAYLLFTSGSTGRPKGVAVSNRNVTSYLDHIISKYSFSPDDRFTQLFDLTFDLSVHDLFLCWSVGACLCVPENNSSFGILSFLKTAKPTVWFSVPSVIRLMQRMRLLKPAAFPFLKTSFFCGEALHSELASAWADAAPSSAIINLYGPTEATIAISDYEINREKEKNKSLNGVLSIGKVFPANNFIIIDEENKELDAGNSGELCISGIQVVNSYWEDETQTDAHFFDKDGKKWYRSGDLAVRDEEGDFFYLGRKDAEVKISGYRVNLMEIENTLGTLDGIDQVVAIYLQARDAPGSLIAFVQTTSGKYLPEATLAAHCRKSLPWYMVPEKFIFVNDFPLNANGKIDKSSLIKNLTSNEGN